MISQPFVGHFAPADSGIPAEIPLYFEPDAGGAPGIAWRPGSYHIHTIVDGKAIYRWREG